MAAAAVPVMIATTALSTVGALSAASSAKKAAYTNASAMDQNAAVLDENAGIVTAQAGQREEAQRRSARMILGSQRAAVAEAGGGTGGTAADIMRQSAINAELDAMTIRYEGALQARGLKQEAASERRAAVNERYTWRQAKKTGYFNAAGSILSGAGSYAGYSADKKYQTAMLAKIR